jgi:hypothetical protein
MARPAPPFAAGAGRTFYRALSGRQNDKALFEGLTGRH